MWKEGYFLSFNGTSENIFSFQKPMMRGSPGPPSGMRGGPGPNFANINNIHQCEIHMKPKKRKNFLQAWLNKFPTRAKKIDVLAWVIFPAIFAFFNMSYWTFYLTLEANTDVNQGMVDGSASKPALRQDTGFWGLFNASVTQIWF